MQAQDQQQTEYHQSETVCAGPAGEPSSQLETAQVRETKAEAELRRVLASIADHVWSCEQDQQGQLTNLFYSPVVERVTGRSPAYFSTGLDRWLSIVHPDDRTRLASVLAALQRGERQEAVEEYRIIRTDGAVRWLRESIRKSAADRGTAFRLDGVASDVTDRHSAEEALQQSEERFQLFMNNCPAIAFIKDEAGRYVYGNQTWATQFAASPQDLLGKTDQELWPVATARLFQKSDTEALDAKVVESIETSRTPSGDRCSWWVQKFQMATTSGRRFIGGMALDVSARIRAEDQERLARRLLLAISNVQAGFIQEEDPHRVYQRLLRELMALTDSAYGVLAAVQTPRAGEPVLQPQAAALTDPIAPPWPAPALWSFFRKPLERVAQRRSPIFVQGTKLAGQDPASSRYPSAPKALLGLPIHYGDEVIAVVGLADRRGGYDGELVAYLQPFLATCASVLYACDNKQRRLAAENDLRASQDKYRTLIENLPQCVFLKDNKLRFVAANESFCSTLGVSEKELIGKSDSDFYVPAHVEKYRADDTRVLAGERIEVEEECSIRGFFRTVRTVKTPVRDVTGKVAGVLGIFWDVTEQRSLEAQLRQAQKMEAIGQLAGGVAHDFNNLLQAVLGNLALVLPSLEANDPNRLMLQSAERASQRAADLVRQLLGFSRRTLLRLEPFPLNQCVQETVSILRRTIDPRIRIEMELDPVLWLVQADHGQMNQVLMNLCLNARDAMPEGGQLRISTSNVLLDESRTRSDVLARSGAFACLRVSDTGHGMTPDVRARVFEPFFTTKGQDKGTGLGLAMVLGIIAQHQGWITCQSTEHVGTVFEIFLPGQEAVLSTPDDRAVERPPRGGSETILFVDDEPIVRSLGTSILEKHGYEVLVAIDGQDALDKYRREKDRIDLVLLDLTMPRLSGLETFRELMQINPDVPVVLSSGYAEDEQRTAAGPNEPFLAKPYKPDELLRLVRSVLDQRREMAAASTSCCAAHS